MKKQLLGLGIVSILTASLFTSPSKAVADESNEITIANGISIGTVDVSGMTKDEANAAISAYLDDLMSTEFTLNGVEKSITVTAEDMGITADAADSVDEALAVTHKGSVITRYKDSVDLKTQPRKLPLCLNVDKQATANLIYKKHAKLSVEAKDATLKKEGSSFTYVPGVNGEEVVEVDSVYAINDFLEYEFDGSVTEIDLVTQVINARGSEEELSVIGDKLGTFSTDFSSSAEGRQTNVKNACSFINGTVIYPGQEFSVHDTIAPMTVENGYAVGGAFQNGKVIESIGGGVCQVATTFYNAMIRAEVDVTMRYNHSMLVGYVEPSDDAAIAGDYKDLRVKNNSEYPVYVEGYCSGGILTFTVWGKETRDPNRTVRFESVVVSQEEAGETKMSTDSSAELGITVASTAHLATKAQLWKIVEVNGVEQSRDLFNTSEYSGSPREIIVGTNGLSAEQLAIINAAIATKDEEQVKAAVESVRQQSAAADPGTAPQAEAQAQ